MLATAKDLGKVLKPTQWSTQPDCYWTILLLSPSGFFPKLPQKDKKLDIYWMATGKQQNKQTAELAYVVDALREVEKRWAALNQYIADLLSEDFMKPKVYAELLVDDKTFTRSKRYFWVIACLNEFDVSIGDNIKQWELFREARVIPFLDAKPKTKPDAKLDTKPDAKPDTKPDTKPDAKPNTKPDTNPVAKLGGPEEFQALHKKADNLHEALQDLQSQFRFKLATVRTLRDGVSCILLVSFLYMSFMRFHLA